MITVFTTPDCQYCPSLKKWLTNKGYQFKEKNMLLPNNAAELRKYTDSFSPPISIVNGQPVQGLNYMRIKKLMGEE